MRDLARTIRATPPTGRMHVLLGHPESDACDKTTVVPGNTFSPGQGTCGVSLWIETPDGRLWTPDTLPDEAVAWGFTDRRSGPPLLDTQWPAGERIMVSSKLGHLGGPGAEGVDFCEVQVAGAEGAGSVAGACFLVVRAAGPAGAKITALDWDAGAGALQVGGGPRIVVEDAPQAVTIIPADAEDDSPVALLRYPFALAPGQILYLSFKAEHGFPVRAGADPAPLLKPYMGLAVDKGILQSCLDWTGRRPGRLISPDTRLVRVWDRSAYHLQAAMENGLPRAGDADAVLTLRALDVMGSLDLGRAGCDHAAPRLFDGGFGAGADALGKGIWALVSHARITQDFGWLAPHFPWIARRMEWLEQKADAAAPLPDFDGSGWIAAGVRMAAHAADVLGEFAPARAWAARADRLEEALAERFLAAYGVAGGPRIAPHPTEALAGHTDALREMFGEWHRTERLDADGLDADGLDADGLDADGTRLPERRPEREIAQAHNAFRLGLDDLGWRSLESLLDEGGIAAWPVSAFGAGLPHNRAAAEWILLLRDLFVRDDGERLILGPHLPRAWRLPGARFGARDLPTRFGLVTYQVTVGDGGAMDLRYDGPGGYEVGWDRIGQDRIGQDRIGMRAPGG